MRERIVKAIKFGAVLVALGCAYLIFVLKTGKGIPCIFNAVTGLECPGCGTTRMIVSIARLDFKSAFGYNPAVFSMLPLIAFFIIRNIYCYIRFGKYEPTRAEKIIQIIMIAVLILFGIIRNFVG